MDDLNEVRKVSEAAYRFLSRINPKDCQDGHYGLPDGVFANIQTYMPKPKSEGTFEAHRKYIDIQYIIYLLEPGDFLILYPKDAHMPGVCEGTPEKVQKAVVKVPCSY